MGSIEIRTIEARDTLELRRAVLWPDLMPSQLVVDADDTAFHFGAFQEDNLIGVASFFPDGRTVRLRKFAVLPDWQARSIGSQILSIGIERMREFGFESMWCDARVSAISFYKRHGFQMDSDVFLKSDLEYVKAKLNLR